MINVHNLQFHRGTYCINVIVLRKLHLHSCSLGSPHVKPKKLTVPNKQLISKSFIYCSQCNQNLKYFLLCYWNFIMCCTCTSVFRDAVFWLLCSVNRFAKQLSSSTKHNFEMMIVFVLSISQHIGSFVCWWLLCVGNTKMVGLGIGLNNIYCS